MRQDRHEDRRDAIIKDSKRSFIFACLSMKSTRKSTLILTGWSVKRDYELADLTGWTDGIQ